MTSANVRVVMLSKSCIAVCSMNGWISVGQPNAPRLGSAPMTNADGILLKVS